jgi:hypothetical protein
VEDRAQHDLVDQQGERNREDREEGHVSTSGCERSSFALAAVSRAPESARGATGQGAFGGAIEGLALGAIAALALAASGGAEFIYFQF